MGMIYLAWQGKKDGYGMELGTGILLVMLAVFYTLHYGVDIVYYRGLLVSMLLMSVLAGAGVGWVMTLGVTPVLRQAQDERTVKFRSDRRSSAWISPVAGLIIIGVLMGTIIPMRLQEPYYHMVEAADYRAFRWIGEYPGDGEGKGLVDPWQGMAFAGVTGMPVYSLIGETPDGNAAAAYEFSQGAFAETSFLVQHNIAVVYTNGLVENTDLNKVRGAFI